MAGDCFPSTYPLYDSGIVYRMGSLRLRSAVSSLRRHDDNNGGYGEDSGKGGKQREQSMRSIRRSVREWLHGSTKTDFKRIVEEAKISDDDMRVLDMKFIHGMSNVQIAMECHCSREKINYIIKRSYDKIAKLL